LPANLWPIRSLDNQSPAPAVFALFSRLIEQTVSVHAPFVEYITAQFALVWHAIGAQFPRISRSILRTMKANKASVSHVSMTVPHHFLNPSFFGVKSQQKILSEREEKRCETLPKLH
jgi:hypothetical protein